MRLLIRIEDLMIVMQFINIKTVIGKYKYQNKFKI